MKDNTNFETAALELRCLTTTLENLRGQIFDDSYRRGSLMIFRAMVIREELNNEFSEEKFAVFQSKIGEISDFIDDIIKTPNIFGSYLH